MVFHSTESFTPYATRYWAIGDNSSSSFLELFRHACHSFRMVLFFLIAGFFAHLLWQRRGVGEFIRNRVGRILIPFVVGWLILYPLLVFLWLTGASKSGHWEVAGVPEAFRSLAPWKLTLGFFQNLQFIQEFDLTHLWFLYQLLVLYVIALIVRWMILRPARGGRLVAWLDRWFRAAITSPWKLLWFAAAALPALYLQQGWDIDTPNNSLIPSLPTTLLYGLSFGVGWALHRQSDLLAACGRHWRWYLLTGVLLVLPSFFFNDFFQQTGLFKLYRDWIRLGHCLIYSLMMWSFVFGFLGCCLHFRRTESPAWRYLTDASYGVYMIHLPLVVALQIWVSDWPLSWMVKVPIVQLIVFPVAFLSYHYLVRSTFLGQQLNGRRYPLKAARGSDTAGAPALVCSQPKV